MSRGAACSSMAVGGITLNRDRGYLTMPPLTDHRAYGSVPRRFGGLSARQRLYGKLAMILKAFVAEGAMQRARRAQPPGSLWAENGRTVHLVRDLEATEFAITVAARLPLNPYNATQAPSCPAVQSTQFAPFA